MHQARNSKNQIPSDLFQQRKKSEIQEPGELFDHIKNLSLNLRIPEGSSASCQVHLPCSSSVMQSRTISIWLLSISKDVPVLRSMQQTVPFRHSLAELVLRGTKLHVEMTSVSCIEKYFIKGSTCPVTTLLRPERSQDFLCFQCYFLNMDLLYSVFQKNCL